MDTKQNIIIEPKKAAQASVIWLHGLGASADDFSPIVPVLKLPEQHAIRFIFPNAPVRPVTLNMGMHMPAWYDIYSLDRDAKQDKAGILASEKILLDLIEKEKSQGIPSERIFLVGFSQGAAMVLHTGIRYPEKLAGIIALSGYLPLADEASTAHSKASLQTPVFLAHGLNDAVVSIGYGRVTKKILSELGYEVSFHEYAMGHEVCYQEINDIRQWIFSTPN